MPKLHASSTQDRIADLIDPAEATHESPGRCIACGVDAEDAEPDAAKTICDCCGRLAVYGVELIVVMAL